MVDHPVLDRAFHALSDSTRRTILRDLTAGPTRISDLAARHPMSLQAVSKHVRVLEGAGFIMRRKTGREIWCVPDPRALEAVAEWIGETRRFWSARLDELAAIAESGPNPAPGGPSR